MSKIKSAVSVAAAAAAQFLVTHATASEAAAALRKDREAFQAHMATLAIDETDAETFRCDPQRTVKATLGVLGIVETKRNTGGEVLGSALGELCGALADKLKASKGADYPNLVRDVANALRVGLNFGAAPTPFGDRVNQLMVELALLMGKQAGREKMMADKGMEARKMADAAFVVALAATQYGTVKPPRKSAK